MDHYQFNYIKENWQTKTIPQLQRGTKLSRHKVIQICIDNGFTVKAVRRTDTLSFIHQSSNRKYKSYKV